MYDGPRGHRSFSFSSALKVTLLVSKGEGGGGKNLSSLLRVLYSGRKKHSKENIRVYAHSNNCQRHKVYLCPVPIVLSIFCRSSSLESKLDSRFFCLGKIRQLGARSGEFLPRKHSIVCPFLIYFEKISKVGGYWFCHRLVKALKG